MRTGTLTAGHGTAIAATATRLSTISAAGYQVVGSKPPFAAANGGFDPTTWYPAALIVLSLVAVAAIAVPWPAVSVPVRIALAALGLYAAWSYLSIAWAVQK